MHAFGQLDPNVVIADMMPDAMRQTLVNDYKTVQAEVKETEEIRVPCRERDDVHVLHGLPAKKQGRKQKSTSRNQTHIKDGSIAKTDHHPKSGSFSAQGGQSTTTARRQGIGWLSRKSEREETLKDMKAELDMVTVHDGVVQGACLQTVAGQENYKHLFLAFGGKFVLFTALKIMSCLKEDGKLIKMVYTPVKQKDATLPLKMSQDLHNVCCSVSVCSEQGVKYCQPTRTSPRKKSLVEIVRLTADKKRKSVETFDLSDDDEDSRDITIPNSVDEGCHDSKPPARGDMLGGEDLANE
jgi:hypothetical protein